MTEPHETLRDGRYVVLGTLGLGSQGKTLDAVDKREGRPVAIKRFDLAHARAWKDVELAEREARVLGSLSHPMLPRYIEHFEEGGALYLVMEKIEGESLASLRKKGRLSDQDALRLLHDAAEVLDYLHGRAPPVFHRDLKPANVIRRPDGSFAFVDFGAVRERMRPEGGSTVVGTFGYMAPEQFQGRAGPGSDVYAVGATVLSMLTGEEPESLPHRGLAIEVGAALGGRANPRLRHILERMLEPDPDRRATRIGPLLAESGRTPASRPRPARAQPTPDLGDLGRQIRDQVERKIRSEVDRATTRAERHAARRARHARRRAEHAQRRARRRREHPVPFFVRFIVWVALTVTQLVVALAVGAVVPLLLLLLSLFIGAPMRRAAKKVYGANRRAVGAIGRARSTVTGQAPEEEEADQGAAHEAMDVRVGAEDERIRVSAAADEREAEEDEEAEAGEPPRRARVQRR